MRISIAILIETFSSDIAGDAKSEQPMRHVSVLPFEPVIQGSREKRIKAMKNVFLAVFFMFAGALLLLWIVLLGLLSWPMESIPPTAPPAHHFPAEDYWF